MAQKHQPSDSERQLKDELFQKYIMPNLNMVYRLCIDYSFSAENVEENYTSALTNLYKYILTYDEKKSIQTWIHICTKRCVYNLEMNRQKKERRTDDVNVEDIPNSSFDISNENDREDFEVNLDNYTQFYSDEIVYALDQLKESYRRIFLMQLSGYQMKEIAEREYALGAIKHNSLDAIRTRLFLARKQLRKILNRNGKLRALDGCPFDTSDVQDSDSGWWGDGQDIDRMGDMGEERIDGE